MALRRRVVRSRLGTVAAFPFRLKMVASYTTTRLGPAASWLVTERETMNFSYPISALNREHMAWFVSAVTDEPVNRVVGWFDELEGDDGLRRHVERELGSNPNRRVSPSQLHWGRRAGWYAFVRALRPDHVVETGTALGIGSLAIASALMKNGHGTLTTIDLDPDAGHLLSGPWAGLVDRRVGDSVQLLRTVPETNLFLHDSLHTYAHETAELQAISPRLAAEALVLSDNAHETAALSDWTRETNRKFLFFKELSEGHWWPGDGIGASW